MALAYQVLSRVEKVPTITVTKCKSKPQLIIFSMNDPLDLARGIIAFIQILELFTGKAVTGKVK